MIRLTIIINEDEHLFPIITNTWSAAVKILNIFTDEDWPHLDVNRIRVKVDEYPDYEPQ